VQAERIRHLLEDDNGALRVYHWPPAEPTRAVVQIVHGMAEHAGRYARFAERLNAAGYAVIAHDQRGHGATGEMQGELGHFGARGWPALPGDVATVADIAVERYPNVPLALLGHSMGSFVNQDVLARHGHRYVAAVLSATDMPPRPLRWFGRALAGIERRRLGAHATSELLQFFSFGAFNRPFKPARTGFDWLSSDPDAVDAYIDDPHCGFACTTEAWCELLGALGRVQRPSHYGKIPDVLPVLMVAGDRDPVARNGRGPHDLAEAYRRAGISDVSVQLYPQGRHELLNDTMAEAVTDDILAWLDKHIERA